MAVLFDIKSFKICMKYNYNYHRKIEILRFRKIVRKLQKFLIINLNPKSHKIQKLCIVTFGNLCLTFKNKIKLRHDSINLISAK
jgi:hypothetical protein